MAHWTDGPEYAPTERPDVFVEPDATVALDPPSGHQPPDRASDGPRPAPSGFTAPDAPPLDARVPASAPDRDPTEAFDVAATPMTTWSSGPAAWGHAHAPQGVGVPPGPPGVPGPPPAWAPDRPFPAGPPPASSHVPGPAPGWPPPHANPGGFPEPGPPPWQQPPPRGVLEPVTLAAMLRHATPGVLICLGLGAVLSPFSLALLVLASVLATRIRYRRRAVGRTFSAAIVGSFLLGVLVMLGSRGSFDPVGWYDASTGWAQLACLVLLVAVPLIVGDALRRGERPENPL